MAARGGERTPPSPRAPFPIDFLIVAVVLAAALIGAASWVASERRHAERVHALAHLSYRRRIAATDLVAALNAAESAERGLLLTGDPAFRRLYGALRPAIPARLAAVRRLYPRDPRVRRLAAILPAKLAELDAADARAVTRGQRLTAAIRTLSAAIVADQTAALEREDVRAHARMVAGRRMVTLLLACLAALAVVSLLALRWNRIERRRLALLAREPLTRLRAVFAGTVEALVILNPSGSIEDLNAAACRLLGYARGEVERRDIAQLLDLAPGEGPFAERLGIVAGAIARPVRHDMMAHGKHGRQVPVDVAIGLMPLPDGVHLVLSLRDVSERKAAERLKDEFISTVSHELRTPLTSVVGALGLLRGGSAGALPDPARRLIDIAENNARRLIRLINDMLDLDRVGGGGPARMEMRAHDLADLAAQALADAQGLAAPRGIALVLERADGALPVTADGERMLQALGNLVSNAIRFSPEGGTVRCAVARDGARARLCVTDEGPGVAPEFRSRIFSRFAQSNAGAAIPGGSGLGLAITREIVRAHEGEIGFDDAEGGGARFWVTLPLHASATGAGAAGTPAILVCEDDPEAAQALRAIVERAGYRVELCGTAREVQALAQAGDYAGVVLDLLLPDAQGLAAVRALRAAPKTRGLPVIVVSAFAQGSRGDPAAGALDVIDWLDKPVDPARLRDALDAAIRRSADGRPTLLHLDDDPDMLEVTGLALVERGRVLTATSLAAARVILRRTTPDIVILDLNLPDGSGAELLPDLLAADGSAVPTIIYSAFETLPEVGPGVEAVLVKSRRSLAALGEAIAEILDRQRGTDAFPPRP